MRTSILFLCICVSACGASPRMVKFAEGAPSEKTFEEALAIYDGKAAAAAVAAGHLDPAKARKAVLERMTKLVEEGALQGALTLADGYGLDRAEKLRFGQAEFETLMQDGMCVRAAEFAKTFGLGQASGEKAVACVRKSSVIEAAAMACDADVGETYRQPLIAEAWDSLDAIPDDGKRFAMLDTLVESTCPPPEVRAAEWFPKTLLKAPGLRFGLMILHKAQAYGWGWDIQAMFHRVLAAAVGFDDEQHAVEVMNDSGFLPSASDIDGYLAYQIAHLRCEDGALLVVMRNLPMARAETVFADPKCFGAAFTGLSWRIAEDDAQAWFELALKHQKFMLSRLLAGKLKDAAAAIAKAETAALDAGDFDDVMDFPTRDGEDGEQHQDRVFKEALDRNDEWFVVRWNTYAQHGVTPSRRDGWIERAYLHALFRKEWKMAADCLAKHSSATTAAAGERVAFEEAMRAENADAAIDLARVYKLGDDCARRAAILKLHQRQEAERAKARAKAAKEKRLRKESGDWYPTP